MSEKPLFDERESELENEVQPVSVENDEQNGVEGSGLNSQILKEIQEEIGRRFQSAKDKRWAQLEKQYGALSEMQSNSASSETSSPAEINPEKFQENIGELVNDLGIGDDPQIIDLLKEKGELTNLEEYFDLVNKITMKVLGKAQKATASAGSVIQPTGGNAPLEDLQEVYDRRKGKLRPGDVNGLLALKREFRGKGLKIY
ncbi:MAG: hypothetical protein HON98_02605 [Chloroflexi bacterium]|jgi:hypothetical protein|nr:hypothetical protein [Chloroflexota bacterium]MBT3668733.1 hypothetical protein [Chloroflexota bacterium]MBT4003225.1 hypothetical protein [Chloroflexota bacterium]MBT4305434.1 hypothetical protein [Chloroflexota bacterium]MBT4533045.1 hypothetical protein [Chloroflexota bacterium]